MSQHDMNIANASGATVRADINDALEAIATNNAGSTAPSTTFAHQWWFDEGNNKLKQRNAANTAWVEIASKSGSTWTYLGTINQGTHGISIPASAMYSAVTNGASGNSEESTTNDINTVPLAFDPSTEEYAWFAFVAPTSVDESSGFTIRNLKWSEDGSPSSHGVVWGFSALARGNGDTLDTALGTEVTVTDTGGSAGVIYTADESSAITPAGSWTEGDLVLVRIARKVGNGSDTLDTDALLHGLEIMVTINAGDDS